MRHGQSEHLFLINYQKMLTENVKSFIILVSTKSQTIMGILYLKYTF